MGSGLILGLVSSTIDILVERTTRFTLLPHLPRMTGHGCKVRVNAIDYVVLARHATLALDAGVCRLSRAGHGCGGAKLTDDERDGMARAVVAGIDHSLVGGASAATRPARLKHAEHSPRLRRPSAHMQMRAAALRARPQLQ